MRSAAAGAQGGASGTAPGAILMALRLGVSSSEIERSCGKSEQGLFLVRSVSCRSFMFNSRGGFDKVGVWHSRSIIGGCVFISTCMRCGYSEKESRKFTSLTLYANNSLRSSFYLVSPLVFCKCHGSMYLS